MIKKNNTVIEIKDLYKKYPGPKGKTTVAVDGISFSVKKGTIFGFLGTNGAGKTTTLRMLSTLLPIESGEVHIAGYNLATQAAEARAYLGYVSQAGGSDGQATALENLQLQGRLYGMTKAAATLRAQELVADFDLTTVASKPARTYSGGQKRRLDIALGIVHKPAVLFLDEPTTGLDPQSREELWRQIRSLKTDGSTVILTSHYLDEVEALAEDIAIMDKGKIVAAGTLRELKQRFADSGQNASLNQIFLQITKAPEATV